MVAGILLNKIGRKETKCELRAKRSVKEGKAFKQFHAFEQATSRHITCQVRVKT